MATYKVPQDVEADDKLIGPFSFRQFIYLIIVVMAIALAWGLAQLFIGLAIIPLPIIVFFGALALPLRKDQPMEIYLAAIVSFYLKPRRRLWDPEGVESLIEITAPKVVEYSRVKDLSQNEAERRLSYLANIVDTQGWAIRGAAGAPSMVINNDVMLEAQSAPDVLDASTAAARNFDTMMQASTERMKEAAMQRMYQAPAAPAPVAPVTPAANIATPQFDPYPQFHQSVIQPLNDPPHQAQSIIQPVSDTVVTEAADQAAGNPPKSDESIVTADIMNLANNRDFSIETIAHEAHRLHQKAEQDSEEVVISLR